METDGEGDVAEFPVTVCRANGKVVLRPRLKLENGRELCGRNGGLRMGSSRLDVTNQTSCSAR